MRGLVVSLLLLPVFGTAVQSQAQERPDVLFIVIDDLNDWVGVLGGHPQALTPNIDALADRGILFTNAHSPAALCNPARTSVMLGLLPSTTGIYGNYPSWMELDDLAALPNLPRYLRENGYDTYGAGKLFHGHTFSPAGYLGYNDPSAWDAYYPSLTRQIPDEIRPHTIPANGNPMSPYFDWSAVAADDRAMADGQVAAWAEERITASGNDPRFVAAGIYRPHLPWYVPQKYLDMYPLEQIVLPEVPADDLVDVPLIGQQFLAGISMDPMELHRWVVDEGKWEEGVQAYLASITFADAMVGQLLEALESTDRADDTIIVLWSDHGWHLGEKHRWRKQTLWEESTRVPLIIVAPGVTTPGTRSVRPVSLIDILPTLLELTGVDALGELDGVSLMPLLKEPDAIWDRGVVSTYEQGNHAVRSERYRYIRYYDGSEELYDHDNDPGEWRNLATDPNYGAVKAELARWLPAEDAPDAILLR
jgi:arylsulfatase A-like enzyme